MDLFAKTRPCKFYAKGRCRRGGACTFAHNDGELRPQPDFFKTQLCVSLFSTGSCSSGAACTFAHSPQEIRRSTVPHRQADARRQQAPAAERRGAPQQRRDSQVHALQAELVALQAELKRKQAGLQKVVAPPPRVEGEDCDFSACANAWSRQSTDEGPAQDDVELSEDDADNWCGGFDLEGKVEGVEAPEREEEIPCELVVKRTFLCLTPREVATAKRSLSAPPAGRGAAVLS